MMERLPKAQMWLTTLLLLVTILLSGCKTKYIPIEKTIYRDVIKHDTLHKQDSIYIHDSIAIWLNGDTVYKDRWHRETILKQTYHVKVDTFIKVDSVPQPFPVERQLSKWEQFRLDYAVWSMGVTCVLLLVLGIIIYRRIKTCRISK